MRKRVLQYDLNNILIKEWLSITEATNSGFKGVGNVLGGRANTTGGFIWTYKNNK